MKLTLEQFETQWAENELSVTDWFDTTYGLFKELEALHQPKSCDGCKYFNKSINGGLCFRLDITVSTTFYCQGYEPKDTQCGL